MCTLQIRLRNAITGSPTAMLETAIVPRLRAKGIGLRLSFLPLGTGQPGIRQRLVFLIGLFRSRSGMVLLVFKMEDLQIMRCVSALRSISSPSLSYIGTGCRNNAVKGSYNKYNINAKYAVFILCPPALTSPHHGSDPNPPMDGGEESTAKIGTASLLAT